MLKNIVISFTFIFAIFTGSAQTITSVSCATSLCAGKEVNINFTVSGGLFGATNVFTAQLSNATGAFTSPVNIGFLQDDAPATISGFIPLNTPPGSGYRIRVISSSPVFTGPNNGTNISISSAVYPGISISTAGNLENICLNTSLSFTSASVQPGTSPSYQWYVNDLPAGNLSTLNFSSWAGVSRVYCVMTSNASCAFPSSVASNVITVNPENNTSNSWLEKTPVRAAITGTPPRRNGAFTFSIGNKGYFGGGTDEFNTLSDFWEYDTVSGAWTQRASFAGGPRAYAVGFAISEKGYAGTGENQAGTTQSDFYRYDPNTNSWNVVAAYAGGAVTMAAGFSIGTKGYLGTGLAAGVAVADFYEFDPILNVWSGRTAYATNTSQALAFSIGSKGYIGIGSSNSDKVYSFDPSQNSWTEVQKYPGNARTGVAAATIGTRAYCLGGAYTQGPATTYTREFYSYNSANNSWTGTSGGSALAVFPGTERSQASGFSIGTRAYFGHGNYSVGTEEKNNQDFWIFNPVLNRWDTLIRPVTDTNGRRGAVGFSIGSRGYICGGKSGSPGTYRRDLWEFNPATNSWTQKANFAGTPRELAVAFSIGNKGYLGTGGISDLTSALNDFWEYDQAANSWRGRTSFPGTARYGAVGFSIGNKGYIGTGRNSTTRFKDFWEYDTTTNSWLQKADYGGLEISSAVGFSIDAKGYVGTGANSTSRISTFYEYNPTNNTWVQKTNFPGVGRAFAVGFGVNGRGYIGTGENASSQPLNDFYEYDPAGNSWTSRQAVPGGTRFMGACFSIGFRGYVSTGFADGGSIQASDLWEYSPVNTRINTDSVSLNTPCAGSVITAYFSLGCYSFNVGNTFTAQLSDANGSFASPTNIGTLNATSGGSMTVTIPAGTASGTNYRIRIVGNNPFTVGLVLPTPINIAPAITVTTQPAATSQILCPNTTAPQLSAATSGSNLSYQWYSNTTNSNTGGSLISGGNLSTFSPPTTDIGSRYYYCRITSACGSVATTNTSGLHTVRPAGTWLGVTSDWHNAANWCGGVPQDSTNITLYTGTAVYPVISSSSARCRNIQLNSTTNITVSNQLLKINGTISQAASSGFINALNGDIELTHSSAPGNSNLNLQGRFFNQKTIKNLKISKGGAISIGISLPNDTLKISESISFGRSNCSFFIQPGSVLVIQSNLTGTARIADMTSDGTTTGAYSGNSITGNVMIERYLENRNRAWQFLSAPAKGQSIKNAWQEGQTAMGNLRPGYGTLISSNLSNPTSLGFDMASFTPSLKTYNENTLNYDAVTSTNNLIDNPRGYMLFVRGDRSVTSSSLPSKSTTLRITGSIYQASDAPPVISVPRGKFMSVGNPYASAINMVNLTRSGVIDSYVIWDPRLTNSANSSYGLGGFRQLVKIPGSGYRATPSENTTGVSYYESANTNVLIQSGQAFFVQSDSTLSTSTLTFSERCKAAGSASVLRPSGIPDILSINLNVIINNENILLDGAIALFDRRFNDRLDGDDIPKMILGSNENISISSGGRFLVAEQRKLPNPADTIHLEIRNLRRRTYSLEFSGEIYSPYAIMPILVDRLHGTFFNIEKTGINKYNFDVTADPASSATNRFYIIFRPENRPLDFSLR